MEYMNDIFKKIACGEAKNISLEELIENRDFIVLLEKKFGKLDMEIPYNVSYGNVGREEFVTAKSDVKLTIIEDMILSKFNSLIFHCEKKEDLCNAIKQILKAGIKFVSGGLFGSVKLCRIKTLQSKYGSIEVSSLFEAFKKLDITGTDLNSWGFFELFKETQLLSVIKSGCNRLNKPKSEFGSEFANISQFGIR